MMHETLLASLRPDNVSDEYILGVQDAATYMRAEFERMNMLSSAHIALGYSVTLLYHWWKINVRDNEFREIKEIEVM